MTRAPKAIGSTPVVRVVAPSGALGRRHLPALQAGLRRLERAGCAVRWEPRSPRVFRGYLAGDDAERSGALLAALNEPEVDIVWIARGGSGLNRIIPQLIAQLAHTAPRVVIGFSDATALLNALSSQLGWITFHGPVVTSLGRPEAHPFDLDAALEALRGEPLLSEQPTRSPILRGRLMGGNLTVLAAMMGTPFQPSAIDAIWLLEDVAEPAYRVDRSLTQCRQAGLFDGARGVWLGDFDDVSSTFVAELIRQDLNQSAVVGAPAGHSGPMGLLPIGAQIAVGSAGFHSLEPIVHRGVS